MKKNVYVIENKRDIANREGERVELNDAIYISLSCATERYVQNEIEDKIDEYNDGAGFGDELTKADFVVAHYDKDGNRDGEWPLFEKKYWKVYSNACRMLKRTSEITESEALTLITEATDSSIERGTFDIGLTGEETYEEYTALIEKAYDLAINYFNENNEFECGDFVVTYSEDAPDSANGYDHTSDYLKF